MRDSSRQGGGADHVGGLAFVHLLNSQFVVLVVSCLGTDVAEADILNQRGVNLGLRQGLLQQSVDHVVKLGILEAALASLGQRSAQR